MALDTQPKRWGMLRVANGPVPSHLINPTGSDFDSVAERLTVLGMYGGLTVTVNATSITVSSITGGPDLTSLSYVVFDAADIGSANIIKQANDETTDSNGDLIIDLTGLGVLDATVLTIVISNYTTAPALTNRGAVCFGTAVA